MNLLTLTPTAQAVIECLGESPLLQINCSTGIIMPTSTQFFNPAKGLSYLSGGSDVDGQIISWYELNTSQTARLYEAVGLWDDVSGFSALIGVDDTGLARKSTTLITETDYFLGIPVGSRTYWENSLPQDWTRVAVGDIRGSYIAGINKSYGANYRYHEVFIDTSLDGVWSFEVGSHANYVLVHELGHSIISNHISGSQTQTVMDPSAPSSTSLWYASTPMSLDIDAAAALYGAATTTRLGDDTYGFNAVLSGAYRSAFDFDVNKRPLVTIFDNGGIDTFDVSGFRNDLGEARSVYVDLRPGMTSFMLDGQYQSFAVIYKNTLIENAVSGSGNDTIHGNDLDNNLVAGDGNDYITAYSGNDFIDGGRGNDRANLQFSRASYNLSVGPDGLIAVRDLTDTGFLTTLMRVETIQFSDEILTLVELGLDDFGSTNLDAGTIEAGATRTGIVETRYDEDWFSINLIEGVDYRFELSASGSGLGSLGDAYLSLRDSGSIVSQDDDSGPSLDALITYTAGVSGTFFLEARALAEGLGTYSLSVMAAVDLDDDDNIFEGTSGRDWVRSAGGHDELYGLDANDWLDGGAGNDRLDGGSGIDTMVGGEGNDIYVVDNIRDVVSELGDDTGIDTIESWIDFSLDNALQLTGAVENLTLFGSIAIKANGNHLDNIIIGNAAANTINGGLGNDTLIGGNGNDTFIVDAMGDHVVEAAGGGRDAVAALVNYTLAAGQEIEELRVAVAAGDRAINLTGNEFAQTLKGNGGANVLDGLRGADTLIGGAGNDTYIVDNVGDRIVEALGGGTDTVRSSVSYTLASNVENLVLTGSDNTKVTGNGSVNTLTGNGGANILDGKAGADTLIGEAGNDGYIVDNANDRVIEAAGGGRDNVATTVSYTLTANQEIEELRVAVAAGDRAIDLTGNSLAQTLIGNNGANVLNGAWGNDVLTGKGGADTFVFANALGSTNVDRITDFASEDTIRLSDDIFTALAPGELTAAAFKNLDTGKGDADDRIMYKQSTGELFYDADGWGGKAMVKFAVLDNKAAVTAADFFVV